VKPRRVVIDTDGGVDDAAAIWWALTDPAVELLAVTTVRGVVDARQAAGNVLLVLEAAGRTDIPVAVGTDDRIGPSPALRPATFIHGDDGLGNTRNGRMPASAPHTGSALDLLAELLANVDGVSLVTLGPLTNVAMLVRERPQCVARVDEVVVMGGVAAGGGNAMPAGEANIVHDPDAAAIVVAAPWNKPPLMVGLDVTHRATLDDSDFALLAERRTPAAAFLDAPLRFYRTFGSTFTAPACPCHDLLAMLALIEDGLMTETPVLPLAISTAPGPAWGSTVVDFRAPVFARRSGAVQARPDGFHPWRIALGVDRERFRRCARRLFGANEGQGT
jgi:purine nucleosidase